ncbi:MAG: DUF6331 family protein [Verrucomicrobia bacterium]|nr:DUF6331 family protein [Verrucomicrobiota bacterium]
MTTPAAYQFSDTLAGLISYCEKECVADCCGLSAFSFSPLHVASYLCSYTGRITAADLAVWKAEIAKFERETAALPSTPEGFACVIESMNQYFTREDLAALVAELRHSLAVTPELQAFSDKLSFPTPTHEVVQASWERIKKTLPAE